MKHVLLTMMAFLSISCSSSAIQSKLSKHTYPLGEHLSVSVDIPNITVNQLSPDEYGDRNLIISSGNNEIVAYTYLFSDYSDNDDVSLEEIFGDFLRNAQDNPAYSAVEYQSIDDIPAKNNYEILAKRLRFTLTNNKMAFQFYYLTRLEHGLHVTFATVIDSSYYEEILEINNKIMSTAFEPK